MGDTLSKFWDDYEDYADLARMMGRTPLPALDEDWRTHLEALQEELREQDGPTLKGNG